MLSERAEELSSIAEELDQADPSILKEVFFLAGVARNAEHLRMCGVERARAVATIRSPMSVPVPLSPSVSPSVSGSSQGSKGIEAEVMDADMQTIMTSLNLHMMLLKSNMNSRYDRSRDSLCDGGADTSSTRQRQRDPHAQTFTGVTTFHSVLLYPTPSHNVICMWPCTTTLLFPSHLFCDDF